MTKQQLQNAVSARLEEMETALVNIPDDAAVDAVTLFRKWEPGMKCEAGKRLQYDSKLYRVIQTHTAQAGWEPDKTPALFTQVAKPGEIPVWRQPTGAQDAYMAGDRVHYPDAEGPVYESTVDNNVWAPGVYGWEQVE